MDKLNTPDDLSQALRDLAEKNGDFMDARYGTAAYQMQMDIRNTRILLRLATSDLIDAAQKAQGMDPAAIADMLVKEQRASMVFRKLSTLSSDWAHAGHELNKVMEGWESVQGVTKLISDDRELFQRTMAQKIASYAGMDDPEQAAKFASDTLASRWEKIKNPILSYFINNLISGPLTHTAYFIGNESMALFKAVPATAFQAAVSAIQSSFRDVDAADRVYFSEVFPQLHARYSGFVNGLPSAVRAFKTGVPELAGGPQAELAMNLNSRQQVLPGAVGRFLETPSRGVSFLHTLSYSMSYSQEIGRMAAREAVAKGLSGADFNAEVARLTQSPTPEMMERASNAGMHGTLMQRPDPGSLQSDLVALTNKHFMLKLAVPFMQIGTNILTEGADYTGLSLLSKDARAELIGNRGAAAQAERIGKISAGSAVAGGVVALASQGMITGGGPTDPKQREVLRDLGWQPYSLKIGNTYYPYRKWLGPMGPLVAASANMYEIGHSLSEGDLGAATKGLAFGFSEVVANETWMSGVANLVDAVGNRNGKQDQYLRNLSVSFLPWSVGLGQVARMVDPYQRQVNSILDAAKNKIPFVSETLAPQIGIWGQPIDSHTMLSPSAERYDPVDERYRALGTGPTRLERSITGIHLSDQQYAEYARMAGTQAHQLLSFPVSQPGFQQLPAGQQIQAMNEMVEKSRRVAQATMKMRYPQIPLQAAENKLKLRTDGRHGLAY